MSVLCFHCMSQLAAIYAMACRNDKVQQGIWRISTLLLLTMSHPVLQTPILEWLNLETACFPWALKSTERKKYRWLRIPSWCSLKIWITFWLKRITDGPHLCHRFMCCALLWSVVAYRPWQGRFNIQFHLIPLVILSWGALSRLLAQPIAHNLAYITVLH